jgi:hypothetical protein
MNQGCNFRLHSRQRVNYSPSTIDSVVYERSAPSSARPRSPCSRNASIDACSHACNHGDTVNSHRARKPNAKHLSKFQSVGTI